MTREPTPAEKGKATRERNLARQEQAAKARALSAPVRQARKSLLSGMKSLAMALRPVSVWTVRTLGPNIAAARREKDIADTRERVDRLLVAWDTAMTDMALAKRAARAKAAKQPRKGRKARA